MCFKTQKYNLKTVFSFTRFPRDRCSKKCQKLNIHDSQLHIVLNSFCEWFGETNLCQNVRASRYKIAPPSKTSLFNFMSILTLQTGKLIRCLADFELGFSR